MVNVNGSEYRKYDKKFMLLLGKLSSKKPLSKIFGGEAIKLPEPPIVDEKLTLRQKAFKIFRLSLEYSFLASTSEFSSNKLSLDGSWPSAMSIFSTELSIPKVT